MLKLGALTTEKPFLGSAGKEKIALLGRLHRKSCLDVSLFFLLIYCQEVSREEDPR